MFKNSENALFSRIALKGFIAAIELRLQSNSSPSQTRCEKEEKMQPTIAF